MVASKKTEILGTKSLNQCDSIRLYNTETFKNPSIVSGFGLSESDVELLCSTPDATKVVEINTILSRFTEYDALKPDENLVFTFNNNVPGLLNGQGFDTIIFLFMGEILGYICLLNPVGRIVNQSGASTYDLKRTYSVNTIYLTLTSDGNGILVDKDMISLLNDLIPIAETTGRDLRGEENYDFATVKDIEGSIDRSSNYTIHLEEFLSGRDIFTDTTISTNLDTPGEINIYKLGIRRNLTLDSVYSSFEHHQIGYYKGDPSIYIWNDDGEYSIFSLTKFLGEYFDDDNTRPLSYTVNSEISKSEIFQVPYLYEGQQRPTISGFAGKYLICKLSGKQYLLDIDRQSGEDPYNHLYEKNKGWIKWKDPDTGKSYPVTDFSVDRTDPYCRVSLPEKDTWAWTRWTDVIEDVKSLSDTYSDSSVGVVGYNKIFTARYGQWHVTEDQIAKTYSGMTRSVVFAIEENDPFILNDKALIAWSKGTDSEGCDTITYTLYNNDGYYMTQKCYDNGSSLSDGESYGDRYTIYPSNSHKTVTFRVSSNHGTDASSPLEVQNSFFAGYRRGSLPITMDGFRIIGALAGLVFYRIGNTINYL